MQDREDVKHLATHVPLDPDRLQRRYVKELRYLLPNQEKHDLTLKLWVEMIKEVQEEATDSAGS